MTPEQAIRAAIKRARHVVAFTGAGVSAESGVPTFRDAVSGLWARFRPEDLATEQAFLRDPGTVWAWYEWRRELIRQAEPNPAHLALARREQKGGQITVVTQNVDGLHRRAGSQDVVELHGSIWANRCIACARSFAIGCSCPEVPRCDQCGNWIRPGVVWFGEALPDDAWRRAIEATDSADVFLSIGTSGLVEPAASLPRLARARGALVVQINPAATTTDADADFLLRGKAGAVLPALLEKEL